MKTSSLITIFLITFNIMAAGAQFRTLISLKPLDFPPLENGETIGFIFSRGEPTRDPTWEQLSHGYCQVMNSFFNYLPAGESFTVDSRLSDLSKPYTSSKILGVEYSRFGLVAINRSLEDRPVQLHIDIVTTESDPGQIPKVLKECLGDYFELR
jgi:hypothetical protein